MNLSAHKGAKVIWYCHHYAGSPSLGMAYRPYYLSREFQAAGNNAYIIASSFHHQQQHDQSQTESVRFTIIDDVKYIWLKTIRYSENGFKRVLNMFNYALRFWINEKQIVAITGKPDVIIASSTHPLHYPVLEKIARKYDAKIIFEVRDLWPLSMLGLLKIKAWHPFILLLSYIEKRAYKNADHVVSLLDGALPYMRSKGLDDNKFSVIPNGTSAELFENKTCLNITIQNIINQIRLQNKNSFILGYAGALGTPNAIKYLISAMQMIEQQKLPIYCVIVGNGILKSDLEKQIQQLNLKQIYCYSSIPRCEIPAFLTQMDALYLGWNAISVYQYGVSPNKLFDYMMSGRPIIESGGSKQSLIASVQCGIRCKAAKPNAIADAIIQLSERTLDERNQLGEAGRKAVLQKYEYSILGKQYMDLF